MGVNRETGLSFPDWWYIRAAHKFSIDGGIDIKDNENLQQKITDAIYGNEPCLIPVRLNPDQPQAPRFLNRRNPDGSMNPTTLEDSYPFLSPEVIAQEMQCAQS